MPDIFTFLSAIIGLITLIVFFVMAGNISSIKKRLNSAANTYKIDFFAYFEAEDFPQAKQAAYKMFYQELFDPRIGFDNREYEYDQLVKKYKPYFTKVGLDIPPYPYVKGTENLA